MLLFPDRPAGFASAGRVLRDGSTFWRGTRGDLRATIEIVTETMVDVLGSGPVTGSMGALVVEAVKG